MRKALEPRSRGYAPLSAEVKATSALINQKIELAESQLQKEGMDPLADAQEIKRQALTIFAEDPTALVRVTCLMVKAVLERLTKVQSNKAQLRYLRDRILGLEPCLRKLINDPKGSLVLKGPLLTFSQCLEECGMHVQKYSAKQWWKIILASGVNKDIFQKLAVRLNESINQLNLVVSVEQSAVLQEMQARQVEDKNAIMGQMANILELEEVSRRELHAARELQLKLGMEQKEFNSVLGQQLEASSLEMARKLELTEVEQKNFFEAQFAALNQRFVELQAQAKPKSLPPIPADLSIPFYDIIIDTLIKKGSFATIYKGEWCGAPVAIKKVGARLQGNQYKQFINEVNNMSKLRHPNIIQVFGACLVPEACYVMEYASQGTLVQLLAQKNLSVSQRAQLATDLGFAIRCLHDSGGVHRDLNASSVLIDAQTRAKLSGFGLAKSMSSHISTVVGIFNDARRKVAHRESFEWLAPELFQPGSEILQPSDIYALGLTLYYIFTGKSLFAAISDDQLEKAVIEGANRELIDQTVQSEYCRLIKSCLNLNPVLRPTARELSAQLAGVQSSLSVNTQSETINPFGNMSVENIYQRGAEFAKAGRYLEAHDCYLHAAKAGYDRAQTALASLLIRGKGDVKEDKKAAFKWFLAAANQEHDRAQFNLGQILEHGDGVARDMDAAMQWYEKSAAQGFPQARARLEAEKRSAAMMNTM